MNILIDTNILIPLEPSSIDDVEFKTPQAIALSRAVWEIGGKLFTHPVQLKDIGKDKNIPRRELREILLTKYPRLEKSPSLESSFLSKIGNPVKDTNSWVDAHLIYALQCDLIDYLVTEDKGIHKICAKIGIDKRCLTLRAALALCEGQKIKPIDPPPAITSLLAYQLDSKDPIFESLRQAYKGFDKWLEKCKRNHRHCWVAKIANSTGYAGLCIVNPENTHLSSLIRPTLKVCTFKVSKDHSGYRFGELLLHTLFQYSIENGFKSLFVEVHPSQEKLISFLQGFGFSLQDKIQLDSPDNVYGKLLDSPSLNKQNYSPIEYYREYGPGVFMREGVDYHVVPIEPAYHERLFPFLCEQQNLFGGLEACGNTIKKAYLSNSNTTKLKCGDILLFYRSSDAKSIGCLGIIEDTLRTQGVDELIQFMGDRTVYTCDEITAKTSERPALAIRFSLILLDINSISFRVLRDQGVLNGPPQTITTIKPEYHQWLQQTALPQ